ncbi:MAG: hypothetical protein LBM12_03085 [Candidatus Nomurabacteria bacterium]|nr:hypothetical protein [Candidatus Nomurabacteria bacterium]
MGQEKCRFEAYSITKSEVKIKTDDGKYDKAAYGVRFGVSLSSRSHDIDDRQAVYMMQELENMIAKQGVELKFSMLNMDPDRLKRRGAELAYEVVIGRLECGPSKKELYICQWTDFKNKATNIACQINDYLTQQVSNAAVAQVA